MAWLGDKLSQFSNIKDQISTFTKEVLTETTEEVADPSAELHVAKRKISELEAVNEHIKTEFDKLKAHSEELNESLETSECQISAISQEYRKILQEKETELKHCKTENERLRQNHKQLDNSASSPLKELANEQFFHNDGGFDNVDLGGSGTEWSAQDYWTGSDGESQLSDGVWKAKCTELETELSELKLQVSSNIEWRTKCGELEAKLAGVKKARDDEMDLKALNKQLQSDLQTIVSEKDSLQTRLAETVSKLKTENTDEVSRLDEEKGLLESQLGDLQSSITHHQSVINRLQQEHDDSQSHIAKLQSTIGHLEAEVTKKEDELHTLRLERSTVTLEKNVNSGNDGNAKVDSLQQELAESTSKHLEEKQSLEHKLVTLEGHSADLTGQLLDKDSLIQELKSQLAHSADSAEIDELKMNIETLNKQLERKVEECDKYAKQLDQLRKHLLEVEERYTQEALKADQAEGSLKHDIAELREQLLESSSQDNQATRALQEQLSEAQDQLQAMIEQRDNALLQMSNAQEQAHQNATALGNLQTVLEQFQRDQSSELAQALKRSQTELADSLAHNEQLQRQLALFGPLQGELESLREESCGKSQNIEQLQKHVEEITAALEAEKEQRLKLTGNSTERVDRDLVKNLVLGYVQAPESKKPEVLILISKMLDFSEEELSDALKGRGRGRGGWLWGTWGGGQSSQQQKESLSQLFVKFLESESAPKPTPPSPAGPGSIPGYVDSRTDPDRPSLATASLIPHPVSPVAPPSNEAEVAVKTEQAHKQSSILSNVLNS